MTNARIGRRAIATIGVWIGATLAACGGSPTAPNLVPSGQSDATSSARYDAGGGCPIKHCIIVPSVGGYRGKPPPAVLFFAKNANGNVKPAGEISGYNTMLGGPAGIASDSQNNIYVANTYPQAITVYAAGAEGNVAPIRAISGANTQLTQPTGIAIDSKGQLYVANCPNKGTNRINIYGRDANGNVAPVRTIHGPHTNLYCPWGLAFDSQANLYVANDNPNTGWITVYASTAHGDATPERTLEGPATKLAGPAGLAVDASGYIYVVDQYEAISIFEPDANGNEAPVSYFTAPIYAFGIALDTHENMYVTSVTFDDPAFIAVFAAGTVGNEGHVLREIEGKKTRLFSPEGILVR